MRKENPRMSEAHIHRQLLWITRRIDECTRLEQMERSRDGTLITPHELSLKSILEKLPTVILVRIVRELTDDDFARIAACNWYLANACFHIKPILHNHMFFDYHILQGRILGSYGRKRSNLNPRRESL